MKSCDTVVKASKINYIEKPGSISAQIYIVPIIYVENSQTIFWGITKTSIEIYIGSDPGQSSYLVPIRLKLVILRPVIEALATADMGYN